MDTDAATMLRRAMQAAAAGAYGQSVLLLNSLIAQHGGNVALYLRRGMVYGRLEMWAAARADLDRAIELGGAASAYEQRGLLAAAQGDWAAAQQDWQQALVLRPASVIALVNLGRMAQQRGDYQRALEYLDRAIALEPTHALAYSNRAAVYDALRNSARLFADLQRATELIAGGRDSSNRDSWE